MEETNKSNLNLRNKYNLTENKIGIIIIIVTILIYTYLSFYTKIMTLLPIYVSNTFFVQTILPGIFSAIVYAIFTRKLMRIFGIGILTIVIWYIWLTILAILAFRII